MQVQAETQPKEQLDAYQIIGANQSELISFMKENSLQITKVYPSFDIISATLLQEEARLLSKQFPNAEIHKSRTYEQAGERDLPSSPLINTTRKDVTPFTGKGVKVGILDSGIDVKHRDLNVKGGYCALDVECSTKIPYDDDNGHGTHVAGVVAAVVNNTGLIGIAPEAELYGIKALNVWGVGSTSSLIDGIDWAVKNKMDILNLSITTEKNDPALEQALKKAYASGLIIVGAGGNTGENADKSVMYPAKYESVIAVGAVTNDLKKLDKSSVGKEIELAAPGKAIFSTYPIQWDFEDGNADGYTSLSGTSMAAAHVSGVLALYKERFPEMSNRELRQLLQETATDIGSKGRDELFGFGLVQYKQSFDRSIDISEEHEDGKVVLRYPGTETVLLKGNSVVSREKNIWELYGVAGEIEILATSVNERGERWTEKKITVIKQPTFKDISNSQRFAGPIGFLAVNGQLKGSLEGTIRPYDKITRAEAATIIGRSLKYPDTAATGSFKDVSSSSFAAGYIAALKKAEIISGFTDGTFKPDQYVTRGEMAILISKAYSLQSDKTNSFIDCNPSMASYKAVNALVASGITDGYKDQTFKPNEPMSRADFAVFLARVQNDAFKQLK